MNRTAIDWTEYSWNPATGCDNPESVCAVRNKCYARRMATRLRGRFGYPEDDPFKPIFHEDRLFEPLNVKKPSTIFVCSMGDLFCSTTPSKWIDRVLEVIGKCPQHTFLLLTKNPERYEEFNIPRNAWVGTTINTINDLKRIDYLLEQPNRRFLSLEPLYEDISRYRRKLENIDWIIIGAETRYGKTIYSPPKEWIEPIVHFAQVSKIPVLIKENLTTYPVIKEFPFYWTTCEKCRHDGEFNCYKAEEIESIIPEKYHDDFWEGNLRISCPCFERRL